MIKIDWTQLIYRHEWFGWQHRGWHVKTLGEEPSIRNSIWEYQGSNKFGITKTSVNRVRILRREISE